MSFILWILVGIGIAHLLWGLIFGVWWWRLVRNAGEKPKDAIAQDFRAVRESIARQRAPLQ